MLTRIKIRNFACHENTEINFSEGLTIFIGRNGSGKSSVIDAMTYALYGKHTRGSKENIVRDRSNGGIVELEFEYRGKHYRVVRGFNAKGDLESSNLYEDGRLIIIGERKRDEAVSTRIERIFGLSYDRMRTAVVIQQGELDRILSADPKELKELFDDLMGFTAMEKAYQSMYEILKDFERRIINETGRSLQDAERVDEEIRKLKENLRALNSKKLEVLNEIPDLEVKLERIEGRINELNQIREIESSLKLNLERLRGVLNEELQVRKNIIENARKYLELIKIKDEVEERVRKIDELSSKVQDINRSLGLLEGKKSELLKSIEELNRQAIEMDEAKLKARSLNELLVDARLRAERLRDDSIELGKQIALRKGQESLLRLKVDSEVEDVVNIVSEAYNSALASYMVDLLRRRRKLTEELEKIESEILFLREKLSILKDEIAKQSKMIDEDVLELRGRVRDAEKEIEKLGGLDNIRRIESESERIEAMARLLDELIEKGALSDEFMLNGISEFLKEDGLKIIESLKDAIAVLRKRRYDPEEFKRLEGERTLLIQKISESKAQLDILENEIKKIEEQLDNLQHVKDELLKAKRFYDLLEKIRNELYYRDGVVLKSLRTWMLGKVADQARKYLDIFDVRIDDVKIEESARAINFKCYYRGVEVDVKRLSGGEKVALALAIRLAIGDVLGAQRLGFFVLDEPTVHLDAENRRRLLDVFTNLSKTVRQTIVITHDEELFEGTDAKIIKFERGVAADSPTIAYEV